MTTADLNKLVLAKNPFVWRNNRGNFKKGMAYLRVGIPTPAKPDKYKGGDFIGFRMIDGKAIFLSIEVKGDGDTLKEGQICWHNLVIESGGISEIWSGDGTIKKGVI